MLTSTPSALATVQTEVNDEKSKNAEDIDFTCGSNLYADHSGLFRSVVTVGRGCVATLGRFSHRPASRLPGTAPAQHSKPGRNL